MDNTVCENLEDFFNNSTAGYTSLSLWSSNMTEEIGRDTGIAMGRVLESNNTLQELHLGHNSIHKDIVVAIGRALEFNNTLQTLAFYGSNIGPEGAITLGSALETNNTLQVLYLGENNIDTNGAVAIARALISNNTVRELHLGENNIGREGAVAIGHTLASNNTLQKLWLDNNDIGNDGVAAIIRGIARNGNNTQLSFLNLNDNNMTRLPAELAQCPLATLTTLHYSYHNQIEYIPPNVQRWLDRYQNQQNAQIYQDHQNVHNRQIQQCIKDSLNRIINSCNGGSGEYQSFDEVRNIIVNDLILTPECKAQLIEYALDPTEHTDLGITFAEALQYVFTRIKMNEHKDGIKNILNKQMSDALCKCFTGRISRLIDCLSGIDNLVVIDLSPNERINSICQQIYELLSQEGEGSSLTAEMYQAKVESELKERGFELTEEIQTNYIDPILQDL